VENSDLIGNFLCFVMTLYDSQKENNNVRAEAPYW